MKKIVIFKSGLLGDTLVALPALHCLKSNFSEAKVTYIWQKIGNKKYVTPEEVLGGAGLVDCFYAYEISESIILSTWRYIKLWLYCVVQNFDIGIVLEPPHWSSKRFYFLKLCGIKTVISPKRGEKQIYRNIVNKLPVINHISDSLLELISKLNIEIPYFGQGIFDLRISKEEEVRSQRWLLEKGFQPNVDNRFVALAIGSNMQTKRWPLENYRKLIFHLMMNYAVIPIIFGGKEDFAISSELIAGWGSGINAAGALSVRDGVALMKQCKFFVGNDTGTMHMAVSAKLPCIALFSSIDMPGRWYPYGEGHHVMRASVECEGCMLRECNKGLEQCINKIRVEDVYEKCVMLLSNNGRK